MSINNPRNKKRQPEAPKNPGYTSSSGAPLKQKYKRTSLLPMQVLLTIATLAITAFIIWSFMH